MMDFIKKHPVGASIVVLALAIVVPYWQMASMKSILITDDIFTSDVMNDGFPYRYYLSELLKSGQMPLWYPPVYGGFPLLARAEAGAAYPLNIFFYGIFDPYVAFNIVALLTMFTAATGTYLYVRKLGLSHLGGILAGIAFAYSGFMVSHMKHMSMVNAACWIPWGLLALEQSVESSAKRRWGFLSIAGLAIVFGLQILSGHIQIAYYSGVFSVVYALARVIPQRGKVSLTHSLTGAGLGLAVGTMIGAVQLLPTYELVQLSQRSGGVSFDYATQYNFALKDLLMFFYPFANGDVGSATYTGQGIFWEDYGYVGLATLILAFIGILRAWKSGHVRLFTLVAVVSLVLVLGKITPIYEWVFTIVPGWRYFRFPTRLMAIIDLALAILAAYGIHAMMAQPKEKMKNNSGYSLPAILIVVVCVADILYFQVQQNAFAEIDRWKTPPSTASIIHRDSSIYRIYSLGATETHKVAYAGARGWHESLEPYIRQREMIQPSVNVLYGLSSADGYAQLTPNNVVDVWGDQNRRGFILSTASLNGQDFIAGPVFEKLMNVFNVKYVLSVWPIHSSTMTLQNEVRGVKIYRNETVLPRTFLVGHYRQVRNVEEARREFFATSFRPEREALVFEKPEGLESDSIVSGTAEVRSYAANEVRVEVVSQRAALLVISDTFYPGWKADIDGKEANLIQANFCQRAVVVPTGTHEVRMRFASSPAVSGLWISGLGVILVGCFIFLGRRGV